MLPAILLDGVSCGYGSTTVLQDIDLRIEAGEMVGVLGPNGSGKSTLLSAMSGALKVSRGRVELEGRAVGAIPARERARLVACVPQRAELTFDLRVVSLVLMGRYPHISWLGGYSGEDLAQARGALALAGLAGMEERLLSQLSGGELQRALIARALAQQARILLLDEAASGLDIGRQVDIHDLLKTRNKAGLTVVSAIHDLNLAGLYCDRLVLIKNGRIVADGPTRDVLTEANISRAYETKSVVFPHPVTGHPQCLLLPGGHAGGAFGGCGR